MTVDLDRDSLIGWLEEKDPERLQALYSEAYRTKVASVGDRVYLRGLVEISNICRKLSVLWNQAGQRGGRTI